MVRAPTSGEILPGDEREGAVLSNQPQRKTWREWVTDPGDPPVLSLAEVLARADDLGLRIDPRTLRYWVEAGVLPHPTGKIGTAGRYPEWILDLIFQVRRFQSSGLSLAQIAPRMRFEAQRLAEHYRQRPPDMDEYIAASDLPPRVPWPADELQPEAQGILFAMPLVPGAADLLANLYARYTGVPVEQIELSIRMADGQTFTLPVRRMKDLEQEH